MKMSKWLQAIYGTTRPGYEVRKYECPGCSQQFYSRDNAKTCCYGATERVLAAISGDTWALADAATLGLTTSNTSSAAIDEEQQ